MADFVSARPICTILTRRFQVDTGKAFGWTGGKFVAESCYANAVSTGNTYVGAVDQQSPIDTAANVPIFRIYQLYYDQNLR